jgi:streptogramin lyase
LRHCAANCKNLRMKVPALLLTALLVSSPVMAQRWGVFTVAGNGEKGFSGDGGPAIQAQMSEVNGVVRGPDGAIYICDTANQRIRRVAPDGTISTVAGSGAKGYSGDGGPALQAALNEPYEVRFDKDGNLYFVERLNHLVRRVDKQTGIISTVAGNGTKGFAGDGGPATQAQMSEPHSIQFAPNGDLYIADVLNHRVRRVDMKTGVVSTFAGNGQRQAPPDGAKFSDVPLFGPRALDFDAQGNLWLALREGNAVYKFDMVQGTVHHIAGTGKKGFTGNGGPAKSATLSGPKGISIAPNGNVYLADTESHSIRMIDMKTDNLELVAGTGDNGDGPDGDPLRCKMGRPHGVFVDAHGVLIGDTIPNRVRLLQQEPKACGNCAGNRPE